MKLPCGKCGKVEPKRCSQSGCPFFVGRPRTMKKDFAGQTPNIFVGQYGYPDVRLGFLSTEEYSEHDNPVQWAQKNTPIPEIVEKRAALVNSNFVTNIRSFSDRFLEAAQLVAQGKKPTDIEINLERAPSFQISYPSGTTPHGASVKLKQARLTENVAVPRKVDKIVNDDLKAEQALNELYGHVDEYALQKLLTGGLLGNKSNRRLVPTRWGITAVDDTIGKDILKKLREQPIIGEPTVFVGGHLGNYYLVMLFPRKWQYELMEFLAKSGREVQGWTDYENFFGRKNYASDTAGGYYAARLPITEKMLEMKKQASVLVLRFVTDEYTNALGVWVVREAVKKAMNSVPIAFATEELMLKYAEAIAKKFNLNYEKEVKEKSKLLASFKQRSLDDY